MSRYYNDSSSFGSLEVSTSLVSSVNSIIDFGNSQYVSGSFRGEGKNLTNITSSFIPESTLAPSASYALTASYALNGGGSGTSLNTGSTYPITSSWSDNSVSASYAPIQNINLSSYLSSSQFTTWVSSSTNLFSGTSSYSLTALNSVSASYAPQTLTGLETGSSYPITASWSDNSTNAISASYAPQTLTGLETGSTYPITASWSNNSINATSASYAPQTQFGLETGSTYPITSSWSNNSISASYAPQILTGLQTGSTYPITSSWSDNTVSASYAPIQNINLSSYLSSSQFTTWVSSSTNLFSGTASYSINSNNALSASYAPQIQFGLETGSSYPITTSWSDNATNAISASYAPQIQFGLATGSTYPITASWSNNARSASYWNSSSVATILNNKQNKIATGSLIPITASWANNVISASYAPTQNINLNSYLSSSQFTSWVSSSTNLFSGTASYALIAESAGTTLTTGSTYPITASWSNNTETASYITASNVSGQVFFATSASWAETSSYTSIINIQQLITTQSLFSTQSLFATQSISSSYALTASYALNGGTGGRGLETGSTYPITASWANNVISASYAPTQNVDVSSYLSSSQFTTWVSSSTNLFSGTASYANTALSASYAMNGGSGGGGLETGSTYPITSSWSDNSITSSNLTIPSASGAWNVYVDQSTGNLVFNYA